MEGRKATYSPVQLRYVSLPSQHRRTASSRLFSEVQRSVESSSGRDGTDDNSLSSPFCGWTPARTFCSVESTRTFVPSPVGWKRWYGAAGLLAGDGGGTRPTRGRCQAVGPVEACTEAGRASREAPTPARSDKASMLGREGERAASEPHLATTIPLNAAYRRAQGLDETLPYPRALL